MLGKISQLKWSSSGGTNRDLAFVIVILAFGVILAAKLAPYYRTHDHSVAYNKVQTTSSVPKSLLEQFTVPFVGSRPYSSTLETRRPNIPTVTHDPNRPSILERPLFDGQAVVLRVRSLNAYTSNEGSQPIEVKILGPGIKGTSDLDFSPALGGKLIGAGSPNLAAKKLQIAFNELISADGRSYAIQGQAIDPQSLASGIEGDYSSGLPSRLLGITIDRAITTVDQIGTAYLFSSIGPQGLGAQELRTAAMQTTQQASQNIAAEATKDLRETPPEIQLPSGTSFMVRIRALPRSGTR